MSEVERRLLAKFTDTKELQISWDMGLRAETFQELVCQAIFTFIESYWNHERRKLAPTLSVIQAEFPGIELPTDEDLSTTWMTQKIMNDYSANNVQQMMLEVAKNLLADPQGAVKELRTRAYTVAESITPRHSRSDMQSNVEERRLRYYERNEGRGMGVTLGLPELDAHVNRLYPGELCVLGAFSKTGKTMMLCKVAIEARRQGNNPIIFSLEMPKEEIEDRLDALFSGLSYNRLIHSSLGPDEIKVLYQFQQDLAELGSLPIEQPEEGDRTVGAIINRARHIGSDYPIIDQLSFMEPGVRVKDLKEHHSVIMKQLKTEINRGSAGRVPCLMAVQFNRDSQNRRDGIGLDSFANATEVEATCDLALGLHRNDEMRINNSMLLKILGARRSAPASFMLEWHLVNKTLIKVDRMLNDE